MKLTLRQLDANLWEMLRAESAAKVLSADQLGALSMTPDQYVESILAKYAVPRGPSSPAEQLGAVVAAPLRTWAGQQLNALEYSGSYAKETGVHGVSDVDVFISLKSDTTNTLKELYEMLYALAQNKGWTPRQQNVSIGVTINGTRGDLVPGKVQAGYQNYHSLRKLPPSSRQL